MTGILDFVRARVMGRVGARFQAKLDRRVFSAAMRGTTSGRAGRQAASGLRHLEAVQKLLTSLALMAVFDLPFAPLFFLGIFVLHPWMGYLGLFGAGILIFFPLANQASSCHPLETATAATYQAEMLGNRIRAEADVVQSLGMRGAAFGRW